MGVCMRSRNVKVRRPQPDLGCSATRKSILRHAVLELLSAELASKLCVLTTEQITLKKPIYVSA
jgi:hypothetical protein